MLRRRKSGFGRFTPREAQRSFLHPWLIDLDRLEVAHQRRAAVAGEPIAARYDVVASHGGDWDAHHTLEADHGGEPVVLVLEVPEIRPRCSRSGPSC